MDKKSRCMHETYELHEECAQTKEHVNDAVADDHPAVGAQSVRSLLADEPDKKEVEDGS